MTNPLSIGAEERPMTLAQMYAAQEIAHAACQEALRNYLSFPTPHNFELVVEAMQEYLPCWMNGRER